MKDNGFRLPLGSSIGGDATFRDGFHGLHQVGNREDLAATGTSLHRGPQLVVSRHEVPFQGKDQDRNRRQAIRPDDCGKRFLGIPWTGTQAGM